MVLDRKPGACRGEDGAARPAGRANDAAEIAGIDYACGAGRHDAAQRRAWHRGHWLRDLLDAARVFVFTVVSIMSRASRHRADFEEVEMTQSACPLRVGVGGPVGSGKTTLVEVLCKRMRDRYRLAVVTNDIYTKEDERLLVAAEALEPERIMGVETGGCPHTAIREDASINLDAVD